MAKQTPYTATPSWDIGDVIRRRYEIQGLLGQGGMGAVYHAYDNLRQRPVAIKRLHEHLTPDTSQRLLRELALQEQIDHPGVVRTYDADQDPDTDAIFFTMALLQGPSLAQLLRTMSQAQKHPPFSLAQIASLVQRLTAILEAVHQKGIVHGDLKPSHILFAPTDETPPWPGPKPLTPEQCEAWLTAPIRLIDFGLARPITWSVLPTGGAGTPPMMAPEQWQPDAPLGPATDIYALGLILYQMLTGAPHVGGQLPPPSIWLRSHGHPLWHLENAPQEHELRQANDLHDALDAIVAKALAYLPHDRYQRAGHLYEAVWEVVGCGGVVGGGPHPRQTSSATPNEVRRGEGYTGKPTPGLTASALHQRMKDSQRQQDLALSGQPLGVGALEALGTYQGLRHLSLCQVELTDNALIYLAPLELLESFQCSQNQLTGQGLVHLQGLSHLRMLSLSENPLEVRHLAHLLPLKSLRWLSLWRCPLGQIDSTEHLAQLARMEQLQTLHLSETGLRDDHLPALAGLTQLQELHLQGNPALSQDAIERLRLALPDCQLRR